MSSDEQPFSDLEATLKKAASALRDAGVPFLLGGSLASWARGGPETRHDLDLMIKHEDAERALEALEQTGMKAERPPESWLLKAWDDEVLVDLIYWPKGMPVDDDVLARGEVISVLGMEMKVMALEDMIVTKLHSLTEHHLRYETLLAISRALREQVDWDHVRRRTADSPFARAFFTLVEGLGIVEPPHEAEAGNGTRGVGVRVLTRSAAAGAG
jgi:predicted nucleotidyltransferase